MVAGPLSHSCCSTANSAPGNSGVSRRMARLLLSERVEKAVASYAEGTATGLLRRRRSNPGLLRRRRSNPGLLRRRHSNPASYAEGVAQHSPGSRQRTLGTETAEFPYPEGVAQAYPCATPSG